jgi:murein DD-endopeptidase MepM/ murein hydrolase activator NlpD
VDIASGTGNLNITSPVSGTAFLYYDENGFGNFVVVTTSDGGCQVFGHLDSVSIEDGATVSVSTPLGIMGSTGNSNGPHLHWEVRTAAGCIQKRDGTFYLNYPKGVEELTANFVDPHLWR